MKHPDQMRVPADAHPLAEQGEGDRIEGAADFDVAVGVHRALAGREERERLGGQRLQRRALDLDEVRPDLAAGRAVDAQPGHGPIPVPQERIVRLEASKRRLSSALLLT